MSRRTRRLAVVAGAMTVAVSAGVIVATQTGAAADTSTVAPNATFCTAPLRADAGVVLTGSSSTNSGSGPVWSVRVSSTTGGPEIAVLRTPAHTLAATSVVPPVPGTWFFRGCLWNTGPLRTTVQIQLKAI